MNYFLVAGAIVVGLIVSLAVFVGLVILEVWAEDRERGRSELLDALKDLRARMIHNSEVPPDQWDKCNPHVAAAIAKAEGR